MDLATRQVLREHNDLSVLAGFPGETWEDEAVYVRRRGEPAFVLLCETWRHDAIDAALTRLASRLPALAERLGCPVAGLASVRSCSLDRSAVPDLLERARRHDVLLFLVASGKRAFSHPQGFLSWREPSHRSRTVPLPPFPRPGWPFVQDLRPLIRDLKQHAAASRSERARALAGGALERLKQTPALLLTSGSDGVARETADLIDGLLPLLAGEGGRRYVMWSLFYLAASLCLDAQSSQRSWASVKAVLDAMASGWDSWTTKEQRVIVRGLQLAVRKAAEAGLPAEHPLWAEVRWWADRFLDHPRIAGVRWGFRVQELMHGVAAARALVPARVYALVREHEERGRFLQEILRGLADEFWQAPSVERWQELQRLFDQNWLRQFVRVRLEMGTHRRFWDFLHTLAEREHPQLLAWLSLLVEAVQGLEPRRLSPQAQSELEAVLGASLGRRIPPSWLEGRVRQTLEALTRP